MRSSCVRHPEKEPLIVVRRWQLEATGGDRAAAALLSFFEYWHNVKLEQARKARQANDVAERHQDGRPHEEGLIQHHNEQELREGTLLFGRNSLNRGIEVLEDLGFVEVVPNPNPRYKFDKTRHFLFHPGEVNEWLDSRSDPPEKDDRSSEKGSRSARMGSRSAHLGGTSPETSSETSSEISDRSDGGGSGASPAASPGARAKDGPPAPGMLAAFDETLAEAREARGTPIDDTSPVPRSKRKEIADDVDRELGSGRSPEMVERGVRRLALRWDDFPMELARAIGDVRAGKPWAVEQERSGRRSRGGPVPAPISGPEGAARRREGYEDLFGEGPPDEDPEDRRRRAEREKREDEDRRRREEEAAEEESRERLRILRDAMRDWRRDLDEKGYSLQVFKMKNAAPRNGVTREDVERLDGEVRAWWASEQRSEAG